MSTPSSSLPTTALPLRPYGAAPLAITPSVLGFGAGHIGSDTLDEAAAERLLHGVVDLGISLIDTAPSYGLSEARIGRHLGARRHAVVLSTKGGYGVEGVADWTGEVITRGIDKALAVLRTTYIDIFHLHSCPLETLKRDDSARALEAARTAGKIRIAAYSGENEALAWAVRSGQFQGVQCSVNLFDQRSLGAQVHDAHARGLGVLAKRPLANAPWVHVERPHGAYAEGYWRRMRAMGLTPADGDFAATALRFAAFAEGVSSVIVGASSLAHVEANARAVARGALASDEVARWQSAFAAKDDGWRGEI